MTSMEERYWVEKNSRVKGTMAWEIQGHVTPSEERYSDEKNSRVKGTQAWPIQGQVTSQRQILG